MFVVTLTLVIIITLAIQVDLALRKRAKRMKIFEEGNIPTVPNISLFSGNTQEIWRSRNLLQVQNFYHKKLGETYGTFYGPDPWLLTLDLDLIQKVFTLTNDRNQFNVPYREDMNQSIFQTQGEEWRKVRQALNPTLGAKQMKSDEVVREMDDISFRLIEGIDKMLSDREAAIIEVSHNFQKFSMESIFKIAFGRTESIDLNPTVKDTIVSAVHYGSKFVAIPLIWISVLFPSLKENLGRFVDFLKYKIRIYTQLGKYLCQIVAVRDKCLEDRRKLLREKKRELIGERKMVDALIELGDAKQLDEPVLRGNMIFMFVAGFDTTANTLTLLLWLLAKHPRVQEKLRQSLSHEGAESEYLDWCIKEELRLFPPVPAGVGRLAPETFEHKGMTIFKGTAIVASLYSVHRWPQYWGQDHDLYRPERFGEPMKHPSQFLAFGMGARRCIGSNFAMSEIRSIIPKVLLKYRVECCESTPNEIDFTAPNLIHMIIHDTIDLKFTKLNSL